MWTVTVIRNGEEIISGNYISIHSVIEIIGQDIRMWSDVGYDYVDTYRSAPPSDMVNVPFTTRIDYMRNRYNDSVLTIVSQFIDNISSVHPSNREWNDDNNSEEFYR